MSTHPSVQDPPGPPVQHPPGSYRDAKAEAKSANAHAKSQRPWYKKKRFAIPLGLIVLSIVASGGSGGDESATNDSAGTGGESASKSDDGKSGKVGQALVNAGTTYTVTNVETTDAIGDPDMLGARADGVFVIVSLELTNTKDETKTFLDSSAKIVTADGKAYQTSDKALLSFGDESLMLKDIQPDLTTSGKLAFELPPNKVSGSTLVVEDLFGSGEIKVDLGQ